MNLMLLSDIVYQLLGSIGSSGALRLALLSGEVNGQDVIYGLDYQQVSMLIIR